MKNLGHHFDRPVMMDISKDGTVTFRPRTAQSFHGAIPIFSVETEEEARRMLTYLCTEQPHEHPNLRSRWYIFEEFNSTADLDYVVEQFAIAYERLKPRAAAA